MIRDITITEGYYLQIKGAPKGTITFEPGLNLILGPNGSGKSTLAIAVAAYSAIKNGGWSKYHSWREFFKVFRETPYSFPDDYKKFAPGDVRATITWDKTPVFFYQNTQPIRNLGFLFDSPDESPDGITTFEDQVGFLTGKYSSGQGRMQKLISALQLLGQRPDLQVKVSPKYPTDKLEAQSLKAQMKYLHHKAKYTTPTVILDEPEAHLDMGSQAQFWKDIVPRLAEKYQTIIVSHSVFAIATALRGNCHVIETKKGFLKRSKASIQDIREALQ